MYNNFLENLGLALGFLFLLSLGICAAKTRAENSRLRKKYALVPYSKKQWNYPNLKENIVLRQKCFAKRPRRMLTMAPGEGLLNDSNHSSKDKFGIKETLGNDQERTAIEQALVETELVKQKLMACLYKWDPYYEYYY